VRDADAGRSRLRLERVGGHGIVPGEERREVLERVHAPERLAAHHHRGHAEHARGERALGVLAHAVLRFGRRRALRERLAVEPRGAERARDRGRRLDAAASSPRRREQRVDRAPRVREIFDQRRQRDAERVRFAKRVLEGIDALGRDLGWAFVAVRVEERREEDRHRLHDRSRSAGEPMDLRPPDVGVGRDVIEVEGDRVRHAGILPRHTGTATARVSQLPVPRRMFHQ
jgi:hypothetical protein